MGSEVGEADERPVHEVRVEPFDLDRTEVTVHEYDDCVRAGRCVAAPTTVAWSGVTEAEHALYDDACNGDRADRQDHPVNCVDAAMAETYCRWAGKRLPTEEEWEYAACAGDCDRALGGSQHRIIWGAGHWPYTTKVARRWPGPFGIYDMASNVWEWTSSTYCPYDHPGCSDPRRVVRGGSWVMVDYLFVHLTDRSPSAPSTRNTNLGFRCAKSPNE
jgi:formylglycine-generating enzyme required for sulfatase activity